MQEVKKDIYLVIFLCVFLDDQKPGAICKVGAEKFFNKIEAESWANGRKQEYLGQQERRSITFSFALTLQSAMNPKNKFELLCEEVKEEIKDKLQMIVHFYMEENFPKLSFAYDGYLRSQKLPNQEAVWRKFAEMTFYAIDKECRAELADIRKDYQDKEWQAVISNHIFNWLSSYGDGEALATGQ